jgi:hypothetical protein
MFGLGAEHIRKMPIESGELTGQIWVRDLVAEGSYLTRHAWSNGQTYPVKLSGIWKMGRTSPET